MRFLQTRQYLSADETEYVLKTMVSIAKINKKKLHYSISVIPSRHKFFSLLTCLFGGETYTDAKNIQEVKQNLKILQEEKNLQEVQIMELTQ